MKNKELVNNKQINFRKGMFFLLLEEYNDATFVAEIKRKTNPTYLITDNSRFASVQHIILTVEIS